MISSSKVISTILIVLIAYIWLWKISKPLAPIVRTEGGELQGIQSVSRNGQEYLEYLGIPYAKPPLGSLRFEAPEEPDNWTGIRAADSYGNECVQLQIVLGNQLGKEDCLYLNVFSPKRLENGAELLPTMVFIHGGHYLEGSGNMYRPDYFMDEANVVLVTFNYRLAALGFLNTGDEVIQGNAGLKDQNMALRWVQRNIAQFGGDPTQITLFGESAGAASVHFHMISPKSQGLFHRAISQSGSTLAPWTMVHNPKKQAERFASLLNCHMFNTTEMAKCLKEVSVEKIIGTYSDCRDALKDPLSTYLPTVEVKDERAFLSEHPLTLIKKMKKGVPWMTGINSHEGLILLAPVARNASLQSYIHPLENWLRSIPILLFSTNDFKLEQLQQLRKYYFDDEPSLDFEKYFDNYTALFSDVLFNYGFTEAVKYHSQHSPVYAYHFSYPGEFSAYNIMLAIKGELPPILEFLGYAVSRLINKHIFRRGLHHYGVSHIDELAYLFKLEGLNDITPLDRDYEMSQRMVKLWTSFARNESPLKYNDVAWNPSNPRNANFEVFNIDINGGGHIAIPFGERMKFLTDYIYKPPGTRSIETDSL